MIKYPFKHLKNRLSAGFRPFFQDLQSNVEDLTGSLPYERGKGPILDRMSGLLPYGYEIEPGLFTIDNPTGTELEGVGYVLEIIPQTGATPAMAEHLTALFAPDLPAGTGLQVSLFATGDIKGATRAYVASRTPPAIFSENTVSEKARKAQASTLYALADARARYLAQGARQPLSVGSHFRVRHFRGWLAVVIPLTRRTGDKRDFALDLLIEKAKALRERHIATLKTYSLYSRTWGGGDLIETLSTLLNPQKFLHEAPNNRAINPLEPLAHQVSDPDTRITVTESGLTFSQTPKDDSPEIAALGLSVRSYPTDYALALTSNWIGSAQEDIPCPFLITAIVNMPDFEKTKSHATLMAARAQQIAESEVAHYVPYLKRRAQDYRIVTEEYAKGGGLCRMTHQVLLFAEKEKALDALQAAKAVFKSAHLDLVADTRMHLQSFLSSLPMISGPLMAEDLKRAMRSSTKTLTSVASLAPLIAEPFGTGPRDHEETITPLLLTTGRHGQITPIDLFSNAGNFNAVIVGASGAGKSALTNDLITGNLGTAGITYVIDVGESYKKLATLLGGQWIEYAPETHLVINPFELVRDIKEDMGFLMPILVEMASPNDGLSDFLFSVLQTHVLHCLNEARRSGKTPEITDLVDSLKTGFADPEDRTGSPDPRIQDLAVQLTPYSREGVYGHYFCGTSSVNFTSNFIVLELEGLKSRKSLQSVVLLCLIFLITQDLTAGDKHIRKMVVIDEAWDLLSHKHAASFIENGYRRARKQNASFITITQSFADYYRNPTAQAALENADIRFILRQKPESLDFLKREKKLTVSDWEWQAMKSLRLQADEYAECLFSAPQTVPAVLQIRFDPFSRLLYSTHAHDVGRIEEGLSQGLTLTQSIARLIESEKRTSS